MPARPERCRPGRWPAGLAALATLLLSGCIVVPRTFEVYDPDCHVVARQMDLQPVQIATIQRCTNDECAVLVLAAAATLAASTVISGSIVIVGNAVYWFEKQGRCRPDPQ